MSGTLEQSQGEDENSFQRYSYRPVLSKLEGSLFLVIAAMVRGPEQVRHIGGP